jgi:hypothetical protein
MRSRFSALRFASVCEGRRNGWNKPTKPGDYVIGKGKRPIRVASGKQVKYNLSY